MTLPRSWRIGALVACLALSFMAGYWLRGFQEWAADWGHPVVHADVTGEELARMGFPFARPPGATHVVTAVVGNGMGDIAMYASFDLPEEEASKFMHTLQSSQGYRAGPAHFDPYYLEQLPETVAASLWPRTGFEHAQVLRGGGVLVGHLAGSGRIHAFYTCCSS